MPGRQRKPSMAQMGLFQANNPKFKRQNGRWIATGTISMADLLQATQRRPDSEYGLETDQQRPLNKSHVDQITQYIVKNAD